MKRLPEFDRWLIKIGGSLLTAWLIWISKAVVELEQRVALLDYGVFKKTAKDDTHKNYTLNSDMNLFQFLERKHNGQLKSPMAIKDSLDKPSAGSSSILPGSPSLGGSSPDGKR